MMWLFHEAMNSFSLLRIIKKSYVTLHETAYGTFTCSNAWLLAYLIPKCKSPKNQVGNLGSSNALKTIENEEKFKVSALGFQSPVT
jgi:hypothetical protein